MGIFRKNKGKTFAVFTGEGTDTFHLKERLKDTFPDAEILCASASDLQTPGFLAPDKISAFFLPGARNAGYDDKLGPAGMDNIRAYVTNGGRLMGLCAGAYYSCRSIEWFKDVPPRARARNTFLSLFNAVAKGPIRDITPTAFDETFHAGGGGEFFFRTTDAGTPQVSFQPDKDGGPVYTPILYWGGPLFVPDAGETYATLAHFNMMAGNPPAIIEKDCGKGRIILSSVHPEVSGTQIRSALPPKPKDITDKEHGLAMAALLEQTEQGRAALWSLCMTRLLTPSR